MPNDLITSTIKSEPVRSAVRISVRGRARSSAFAEMEAAVAFRRSKVDGAARAAGVAVTTAAPAATFFKKSRRLNEAFLRGTTGSKPPFEPRCITQRERFARANYADQGNLVNRQFMASACRLRVTGKPEVMPKASKP